MKKKPSKRKLELSRETIAALQEEHLAGAAGAGETAISQCVRCQTGTHCNISLCICQ